MTIGQPDQKLHYGHAAHHADDPLNGDFVNEHGIIDQKEVDETNIYVEAKLNKVLQNIADNDLISLKAAAASPGGFGLFDREIRLKAWYKLTNVDEKTLPSLSEEDTQRNNFYRQVILDVDRSLKRFPPSVHEAKRLLYQDSLTRMIIRVLSHNPRLHYYQGYHDICLTFLLMVDEETAFRLVNRVSNTHLCYYMEETMHTTSNHLQIIYWILNLEDQELHDYLLRSEVGTIFSLSWVITWFSHVLGNFDDIARLFDYFISSHFLMPIYLTVSILLYKKDDIQQIDCDMASMHQYLTNIPQRERLPFDKLVDDSLRLAVKHPPEDTLATQKALQEKALSGEEEPTAVESTLLFIRRNVFSITFVVFVGAMIYQLYSEYS
ncbi:hypothetical protein TYRP_007259 [Tyrophagus putrescentiae]|nr:hypothetical protein TYRP_007259 [Tyrophagus putrescentiae]